MTKLMKGLMKSSAKKKATKKKAASMLGKRYGKSGIYGRKKK